MLFYNPQKTEIQVDVWSFWNMSVIKKLPCFDNYLWTRKWISWKDELGHTHARIGISGTKRLYKCNPHVRKLIWVFPGASYSFHSMAEYKDVSCNLQWYMDQFCKLRHRSSSWHGCHGIGDSYGMDTKFLECLGSSPTTYELSWGLFMFY